jgi:predicted amidohydrolase YtcJ
VPVFAKKCVSFAFVRKNVHAIGDYANGVVLDTFETALKDVNVTALRPRLEHAQILTKTDMERVGKLGGEHSTRFLDESMEVELSLFSYCQHSTYACVR